VSQHSDFPVNDTAKFLTIGSVPKRCNTCSKPFTKTIDETGSIWFCANKNCTTRGWGFHQDASGFILDGVFNQALDHLERYRY
jgi:hypothetical protein